MTKYSIPRLYKQSLALLTDLYQLTMAYGYWKLGLHNREAVFHLIFRKPPFHGGFTVAAGLEEVIDYIENFTFDESDLAYLATLKGTDNVRLFPDDFLAYLGKLRLDVDLDAVPEGTIIFPQQPLIRIQGPLLLCQLLESPLLNLVNFPTLIATKAARICIAAKGDKVLEFGLRRAQGINGAIAASRAAYIGGCDATSNVIAGKLFGMPVSGTHSHSWVMVFDEEIDAFQEYARVMPGNCVFLVDTFNTLEGIEKAINVGKRLRENGHELLGIRLDSGDLAYLSIQGRRMLDEAGFTEAKVVASNELDETVITELKRQGAKIDIWGVGTNLITAKDQPALDGVYKLSALKDDAGKWQYKLKLSEQILKVSNPGILQVKRFYSAKENVADVIYDTQLGIKDSPTIVDPLDPTKERVIPKNLQSKDLLVPIFRAGRRVYEKPELSAIREHTQEELKRFPVGVKRFLNPHQYVVGMEKGLFDQKFGLIKTIRSKMQTNRIV